MKLKYLQLVSLLLAGVVHAAPKDLDGVTLEIPVPSGYCELGASRYESAIRAEQAQFNLNKSRIVSTFGPCDEVKELRTEKRQRLDKMGQYTTPLKDGKVLEAPNGFTRRYFINFSLSAKGAEHRKRGMDSGLAALRSFSPGVDAPQDLGFIDDDDRAIYSASVMSSAMDSGDAGVLVVVSGQTVVRNRVIHVALMQVAPSKPDVTKLLAEQKRTVESLIRANGD
ncbi:hypothetical protein [Variovorax boronicumulans]|uniref:hypothetical protein n=1 Tax=Variovorax boronicumulans TaxID=436515 RepID=UPI003391F940